MAPNIIAWTILLLPLLVATAILLFLRKAANVSALLATGSAFATLVLTLMLAHPELTKEPKTALATSTDSQATGAHLPDHGDEGEATEGIKSFPVDQPGQRSQDRNRNQG